jgi:glycosyltransferase involved in cell wall biosynthesis
MVRACPKSTRVPTIFVNVASYRDPECGPTVADLLAKAANPDAITVGLVLQAEPEDHAPVYPKQVLTLAARASESRGVCWARSMGYRLWDGQDYVLQIDSHMRFTPDWDIKMLGQLARCHSPRPLLTTYPLSYEPGTPELVQQTCLLATKGFGPDGYLHQSSLDPQPGTRSAAP